VGGPGTRRDARIVAFQTLYRYDITKEPLETLMDLSWMDRGHRERLSDELLAFVQLLVGGTVEHIAEVDEAIDARLEHWDMVRLARVDLALLRLSAYSLLYQRDIPTRVTIDEAVEIAKLYGNDQSFKFVNGVLDAIHKHSCS